MLLIQTDRDTLLKPLQAVTGIVERRHTLPILSNVLIETSSDKISFMATDLEIQVTTTTANAAQGQQSSAITVAAKKLQDILRALPDNTKVLLEAQEGKLQLKAGKSRFNLQTLPPEDFPRLSEGTEQQAKISLGQGQLKRLLSLVQYAMAQQDIRYYLNGLLLVIEKRKLKVVATDGHRMAYASQEITQSQDKQEVILPRKAVSELVKLLSDTDEEVSLEVLQNQARFGFSNITLVSKVVDGKFPDYARVIPANYEKSLSIERVILLRALQRMAILSSEKFRGVRLMLAEGSLRILCSNTEQEEAQEELEVEYRGGALDIGFNINYLLDALSNLDSATINCAFGDSSSSMLITIPENDEFKYVVMPMRI